MGQTEDKVGSVPFQRGEEKGGWLVITFCREVFHLYLNIVKACSSPWEKSVMSKVGNNKAETSACFSEILKVMIKLLTTSRSDPGRMGNGEVMASLAEQKEGWPECASFSW